MEQEEHFGEHSIDSNPTTTIDLTTDYSQSYEQTTDFDKGNQYEE